MHPLVFYPSFNILLKTRNEDSIMAKIFEEDETDLIHRLAKGGNFPQLREEYKTVGKFVEDFKYNLTSFLRLSKYVIDYLFMFPSNMFSPEAAAMIKLGYYMNQYRDFKNAKAVVTIRRHFEAVSPSLTIYKADMIEFSSMTGYITVLYANVDENMGLDDIFATRVVLGIKDVRMKDIKGNIFNPDDEEIDLIINKYLEMSVTNIVKPEEEKPKCLKTSEKLLLK